MSTGKIKRLFGRLKAAPQRDRAITAPEKPWFQNKWWRVVDEETHASTKIPTMQSNPAGDLFSMRGNLRGASELYQKLQNPLARQYIDAVGWSQLFIPLIPNSDNKLVEALIARWWDKTHTFHLPNLEIGITPFDFVALSGISVGMGEALPEFPTSYEKSREQLLEEYFPGPSIPNMDGRNISSAWLKRYISKWCTNEENQIPNDASPEQIARAFLLFVIGYVFFPNGNDRICIDWVEMLSDMNRIRTYDWGSSILARIYMALDKNSREVVTTVNCFWQIIEYWAFEYLHTASPLLKDDVVEVWPRMKKWMKEQRSDVGGQVRFKISCAHEQLEFRSPQSIIWQPFHVLLDLDVETLRMVFRLSSHRIMLLDPDLGGTWYLGDRCYRQVNGKIVIPDNPELQMSRIPREEYFIPNGNWRNGENLVTECTEVEYQEYWKFVSKGNILPPLLRWANHDGVGVPALSGDYLQLPTPPSSSFQPGPYETHPQASSSSSDPFNLKWEAEVAECGGGVSTIYIQRPRDCPPPPASRSYTRDQWRQCAIDHRDFCRALQATLLERTTALQQEIARLQGERGSYPSPMMPPRTSNFEEAYHPVMQSSPLSFGYGQPYPTLDMQQTPQFAYGQDNTASGSTPIWELDNIFGSYQ